MGVLDKVTKMKKEMRSDDEIINELSQQGISPREINDALKQAQIKNAVSPGYEPSIAPKVETPAPNQSQEYAPATYETPSQEQYAPTPQGEVYNPQEEQQYYSPGQGYEQQYTATGVDTDTIIEISEQIFSEKIKNFQKQLDSTSEASILLQTKIENISERLKKVETIIDKLQIAILEKVGSYGKNLENIKKEMSMMQNSFSKMVPSLKEQQEKTTGKSEKILKKVSKKK